MLKNWAMNFTDLDISPPDTQQDDFSFKVPFERVLRIHERGGVDYRQCTNATSTRPLSVLQQNQNS